MIEGLVVKSVVDKPSGDQLVDVTVVVTGIITKDELDSLRYCIKGDYDFALYAAVK